METLVGRSDRVIPTRVQLPSGADALIRTIVVPFARATPDRLRATVLPATYTSKPLVSIGGDALFGELAIVRTLEQDGWEAVWVDAFHGGKFWRAMPHRSAPVALPPHAQARFAAIIAANGGRTSGFFDVFAWRDDQFAHLEYKGAGDRSNRNELRWIDAALTAGVTAAELWFVQHPDAARRESAPAATR